MNTITIFNNDVQQQVVCSIATVLRSPLLDTLRSLTCDNHLKEMNKSGQWIFFHPDLNTM
jgi:hypothetical protein